MTILMARVVVVVVDDVVVVVVVVVVVDDVVVVVSPLRCPRGVKSTGLPPFTLLPAEMFSALPVLMCVYLRAWCVLACSCGRKAVPTDGSAR